MSRPLRLVEGPGDVVPREATPLLASRPRAPISEIKDHHQTREEALMILDGWESKEAWGKRIWRKPDASAVGGFLGWYSTDMALHIWHQGRKERG